MQLKRGLNVAIMRNTLTRHLAVRVESVTTRTNIVVTQRGVFTLESQLLANNPHAWKVNERLTETVKDQCEVADTTHHHTPPFCHPERRVTRTEAPEVLRTPLGPQEGRTGGSVGQLSLDKVDQPPQRDVDPARRLLLLEDPDVIHDLGDDVACQSESIVDRQVGGEAAHQRTRILMGGLLVALDVAEHERHHGLGFEGG